MRVRPDMDYGEIPSLLTTAEAAVVAGKSQSAIQGCIRRGAIPAKLLGGEYRIRKSDLFADSEGAAIA